MRYLKFPGDPASDIHVDLNRPDEQTRILEDFSGQARKPDIVILKGRHLDRWHSESVNPHSWYEQLLGAKPTPIVLFKNEDGERCGIVHMRNIAGQRSVCISLVSQAGAWQTGVWLDIEAGDRLSISWFRDWRNTEISAINLEIINAEHEDSLNDEDDLIPLGDEIDLELYAAEAMLDEATPGGSNFGAGSNGLEAAPSTMPVAEPELLPLDPGASVIICSTGEDGNRMALDSKPWFGFQITNIPIAVANLITDHQQLAGKIYLRKLSDWYEYSLSAVVGNEEFSTGSWNPVNPDSKLTLSWSTDRSGEVLEEFHLDFDSSPVE